MTCRLLRLTYLGGINVKRQLLDLRSRAMQFSAFKSRPSIVRLPSDLAMLSATVGDTSLQSAVGKLLGI
jgi:hypothetical protein